ncbi:MAG: J domain-containing protein [Verrucomicrobiales bacterium]|nr:J domain-containing protein [Verrucomicrobiales bacterium]
MALEFKDYYAILGVSRRATDDEIKKAFRRLAREYHPDVAKDKKAAEEKFKEINEAYEVLGNPENRRKYDEVGRDWRSGSEFRPPPGWKSARQRRQPPGQATEPEFQFGGTGFSDFFEALFGGRSGAFRGFSFGEQADSAGGGRGSDVESDILVALDEVIHGSVRTITRQTVDSRDGRVDRRSFQVRIPPGVREGQLIRVAGKGEDRQGGDSGDLYLRVRLEKHPDFRVQDDDLWMDLVLAPWEAVLGATITVRTLEGDVSLRVPPGTRGGRQLRVRGRGLPTPGGGRGDLYVVVTVDVPAEVSAEERLLWEELAAKSRFRPRQRD